MNKSRQIWPWFLLLALAGPAAADEVQLKNGSKLEGAVQELGNKVLVDVGPGTITLDRSEVQSIRRPDEQIQEFDRRVKELKPDDASGYYQAYVWARQQPDMRIRAESLLKKALDADPNYEPARSALGYVNYKGAWLTQDEYKAVLGLVRYQGQWVTADVAERLQKLHQDAALAVDRQETEQKRTRLEMVAEQERLAQRQRVLDMIQMGEMPRDFANALGYPWVMRYWGPAQPVVPQPNAD
jgi:hypothetical protein